MAQIFWGTIHADIMYANEYKNKFRIIATSIDSNNLAAEYAKKLNRLNWVIIHDTTDYGTEAAMIARVPWKKPAVKFSALLVSQPGSKTFSAVLSKVKELNPDGIYYGGVVTEGAGVRKQATKIGLTKVMFIGPPGSDSDTFGQITGTDGEGSFCSGTFDVNSSQAGKDFVKAYTAKYPNEPYEQNGPYAYNSAGLILEAIKAVGPDRAKIIDYIGSHPFTGVIGDIKWNSPDRLPQVV